MKADVHPDQQRRLDALRSFQILDTDREAAFDDVVALVSAICEAPIAVVNFIDSDRQWFKAEVGLGVRSTPLDTSLCSHVILEDAFVEIADTLNDPRMADNPLCVGDPGLRFYAGATLRTADGLPLGTLCVLDYKPRGLTAMQRRAIEVLADQVMRQLELRNALRSQDILRREIDHRVKNSLASVGAMISLQAGRSGSVEVKDALGSVQRRLTSLVALHDELHRSSDGANIDLNRFIERMAANLAGLLPDNVTVERDVEAVETNAATAHAIGVIINEFITNSGKHAFPDGRGGTVRIGLASTAGGLVLELADDGVGNAAKIAGGSGHAGLGTRIMAASAASIGSSLKWGGDDQGLRLTLAIPR